jgi:hydrogenase maturation protein HypF
MTVQPECWLIRVHGLVQGVGYRPFVHQLARTHGVTGWVLNDTMGVQAAVYGPPLVLETFLAALRDQAPPLARVDEARVEHRETVEEAPARFEIRQSERVERTDTVVAPDAHICDACLREVSDPADRRFRYPFTNCTHCGPRYSIIRGLPYDRARTSMASFAMCERCAAEYHDPLDRRYHAQPNACPACGPQVRLTGPDGPKAVGDEAVRAAVDALAAGHVVAVKSVGGFHLAVDARAVAAVALLRRRKKRDWKPFAVMAADLAAVDTFADRTKAESALLTSPARPIVLLSKRPGALPEAIAPRNPKVGVMLPCSALHHLLLDRPGLDVLVMTSGNISGQPIVFRDADALTDLFEVADLILHHDRDIEVRVDDSVVLCAEHPDLTEPLTIFLRRSRGYAPYPVRVDEEQEPVLAFGAELKTTVALADGRAVFVSQHIGDLKNDETFGSHGQISKHLIGLYELGPRYVACDLHPDFRTTRFSAATPEERVYRVQHHHAHMASCIAENRLSGPTIGVVFDGAGYGVDGTIWGGEFLLGDVTAVDRVASLRPTPLLGGDQAVREPVRTGFAFALDAMGDADSATEAFPALRRLTKQEQHVFGVMFRRRVNAPLTSSMGRLFDAVAALLGICLYAEYEAQGPIELEGLLGRDPSLSEGYLFGVLEDDHGTRVDPRPVIRRIAADLGHGVDTAEISRRFHSAVVGMVVQRCTAISRAHHTDQVVLSGGVFLNEFLAVNCLVELRRAGLAAYGHHLVPCNDGGISLGQVAVASARIRTEREADVDGLTWTD